MPDKMIGIQHSKMQCNESLVMFYSHSQQQYQKIKFHSGIYVRICRVCDHI